MVAISTVTLKLLLLCFVVKVTVQDSDEEDHYMCSSPVPNSCLNNSKIRVTKDDNKYQLRLCSNNECANDTGRSYRIVCRDICEACRSLLGSGQNECTMGPTECKANIISFLNGFCVAVALTSPPSTHLLEGGCNSSISPTPSSVTTIPSKSTEITPQKPSVTGSSAVNQTATLSAADQSDCSASKLKYNSLGMATALGLLLMLAIILLASVTIALVWKSYQMKKATTELDTTLSQINRKRSISTEDDDKDEKYFENPTYEESYEAYATPNIYKVQSSPERREEVRYVQARRYDSIEFLNSRMDKGDGETYNVLDRGQVKPSAGTEASNVQMSDNYSTLNKSEGFDLAHESPSTPADDDYCELPWFDDSVGVSITTRDSHANEDYSQLELHENDVKNNYHVITINSLDGNQSV